MAYQNSMILWRIKTVWFCGVSKQYGFVACQNSYNSDVYQNSYNFVGIKTVMINSYDFVAYQKLWFCGVSKQLWFCGVSKQYDFVAYQNSMILWRIKTVWFCDVSKQYDFEAETVDHLILEVWYFSDILGLIENVTDIKNVQTAPIYHFQRSWFYLFSYHKEV